MKKGEKGYVELYQSGIPQDVIESIEETVQMELDAINKIASRSSLTVDDVEVMFKEALNQMCMEKALKEDSYPARFTICEPPKFKYFMDDNEIQSLPYTELIHRLTVGLPNPKTKKPFQNIRLLMSNLFYEIKMRRYALSQIEIFCPDHYSRIMSKYTN
jgi:hypothetical protein